MRTEHQLVLLLALLLVTLCGCTSRVEGSSSQPPGNSLAPEEPGGPAALVLKPEERTEIEVYLGLHSGISAAGMGSIVVRLRKEGRFCGQGCGAAQDENGKVCGAFWDGFVLKIPEAEKAASIDLGYLQNETGLNTVDGDGFEYRLRQGIFHRKDRSKRQKAAPQ